jgi:hypothetical protein
MASTEAASTRAQTGQMNGGEGALLRGSFRILLLYDVAEALDLAKISELLGPRGGPVKRAFPRRTPEYVQFEHAPIIEAADCVTLSSGEQLGCSIKYYAFAVVVVQLEVAFECGWNALLAQASRWVDAPEVEAQAREVVRRHLEELAPAVIRANQDWLQEMYVVVNLQEIVNAGIRRPPTSELLAAYGREIVDLVSGEVVPLAPKFIEEVLQTGVSYSPADLVVVGSFAALVYDQPEDALATTQVLEYAKMQLLEFRYYDALMSRLLSEVYDALDRKRNVLLSRWSLPREAKRINTIRLDVMELTERIDNAIKFVTDTYFAHVYRLASTRIGVPGYRKLVEEKLQTVGELYGFMVDQFNEARSFVLELAVAILVALDVVLLLRWK